MEHEPVVANSGRERLRTKALALGAHRSCLEAGRAGACDECVRIIEWIIDEAARTRADRATQVRP